MEVQMGICHCLPLQHPWHSLYTFGFMCTNPNLQLAVIVRARNPDHATFPGLVCLGILPNDMPNPTAKRMMTKVTCIFPRLHYFSSCCYCSQLVMENHLHHNMHQL